MTLKSINLPKSERFAVSAAYLRRVFGDIDPLSAYRGSLGKTFTFDSRCSKRPRLVGPVVASIQVSRDRTAILQLYPVKVRDYSEETAVQFAEQVLPDLKGWLTTQLAKPETAVLGYQQVVVEWSAGGHKIHEVRFL
jgi:hypothetical protein